MAQFGQEFLLSIVHGMCMGEQPGTSTISSEDLSGRQSYPYAHNLLTFRRYFEWIGQNSLRSDRVIAREQERRLPYQSHGRASGAEISPGRFLVDNCCTCKHE